MKQFEERFVSLQKSVQQTSEKEKNIGRKDQNTAGTPKGKQDF